MLQFSVWLNCFKLTGFYLSTDVDSGTSHSTWEADDCTLVWDTVQPCHPATGQASHQHISGCQEHTQASACRRQIHYFTCCSARPIIQTCGSLQRCSAEAPQQAGCVTHEVPAHLKRQLKNTIQRRSMLN